MKADVNYYTEQFTDEHHFSYLNDKFYDISQDDFSAYKVSPTVKARFKFPNKELLTIELLRRLSMTFYKFGANV